MAYTTYAAFVTAVAGVSVTGVTTAYTSPPSQLNTAALPVSYPRLPELEREVIAFGYQAGLQSSTVEMVFLIEPIMQNLSSANFASMTALVDAIDTAYAANAATIGIDRWNIRQETSAYGETEYWALVATVEASG
jgi:hypothetical protein